MHRSQGRVGVWILRKCHMCDLELNIINRETRFKPSEVTIGHDNVKFLLAVEWT